MRDFIRHIMLLLTCILSASCIFDAETCIMSADEPRSIMFTVSLENHATRASWAEDYPSEDGVPFDLRISPDQLRVVIFSTDGTRIGLVSDLYYWPVDASQTTFRFVGQMPEEFTAHFNSYGAASSRYRFMVLANCADNQNGEQYITYSHMQLDPLSEGACIPMWGVLEADMTPLIDGGSLDLGVIWLLRAAAKIEVRLSEKEKAKGTEICSASLKYYNQTGYSLPSGAMQTDDTRNLDQEECIKVYRHAAVNLPLIKDEDTGDYYIYVTEYDNINYPEERNRISIEFNVGGQVKYFQDAISFCRYADGELQPGSDYSIVRNHIYDFEILSIAGSNLILEYTVADWEAEDWGTGLDYEEHELTYPTYHNPVVPYEYLASSSEEQISYEIQQDPVMYYNAGQVESGAFECFFQIIAPEDVQWKPVFMGSKENYRIRVYRHSNGSSDELLFDTGDDDLQTDLGVTENNQWFRILVFPLSNDGADATSIDFGLSYYQEWTDQYINLYINGEYDNIRWPQSGNNPKIISIRHVSDPNAANETGE